MTRPPCQAEPPQDQMERPPAEIMVRPGQRSHPSDRAQPPPLTLTISCTAAFLPMLTPELAASFARLTLAHVGRQFPYAPQHVMEHPADWGTPAQLHPIFHGSYDWHSCVHGYWQLARLRRMFPDLPQRAQIQTRFDEILTAANVQGEVAYFQRPYSRGFERPYGWAWLLMLADELFRHEDDAGQHWHAAVVSLARLIAGRFFEFCAKAVYPIRAGTHSNTAFALTLAQAYAVSHQDRALTGAVRESAQRWYLKDQDCQAWEPSLDDFLSPALIEAICMRRILSPPEFAAWLARFLPRLADGEPRALFEPAVVADRTDGKIVHLDGLNLSRAWCFRGIAGALDDAPRLQARLRAAAEVHLAASLPHVAGDYMGEHWLASFALLALDPDWAFAPGAARVI